MSTPIPILLYHSVAENATSQYRRWAIRPGIFAAHLAYLHNQGYTPITVTHLAQAMIDQGTHLPERPVVLTFDDGLADFYAGALPVLKSYAFAATLYIATQFVGGTSRWLHAEGEGERPMLTWSQIADIHASGIECGAHSHSHPQLDVLSLAEAGDEITRSKAILEQHLGRAVTTFAYPHGYYDSGVRRLVQQAGYTSACAVKHALSSLADDRFALARIIVSPEDANVENFANLLAGRGLRLAPTRERVRTRGWRLVRRSARFLERSPWMSGRA